jgi:alkylated DNA repair dioxygenase AlkB
MIGGPCLVRISYIIFIDFRIKTSVTEMQRTVLPEGNSFIDFIDTKHFPDEIKMDQKTFEEIWNLHPEEFALVRIAGKLVKTPRWQQSYGQGYYYSGVFHNALPLDNPYLKKISEYVCKHSGGKEYRQMLINWYQDGKHYI